jgi:2-methylcitrate dehydratase PrpD
MPAMNGLKAAALVRSGFTGAGDVLNRDGRNMLDAICPSPRPEALTDGLGERFAILETDIKKYPVGYPIAAPVAALESIIAEHALTSSQVDGVRVRYHEDWYKVVGDQTLMPDVNLRYCLAATILDGRLSFDAAHDAQRMATSEIRETAGKIQFLGPTPELGWLDVVVEVLSGNTTYSAVQQGAELPGRHQHPLTRREVEDKALELMGRVLPRPQVLDVVAMCAEIERISDVSDLVRTLTPDFRRDAEPGAYSSPTSAPSQIP